MTGLEGFFLFVKIYGVTTLLIIFSIFGVIILAKNKCSNSQAGLDSLLRITSVFMLFGILYYLYLVGFPGMSSIGSARMLAYAQTLAPIITAYTITEIAKRFPGSIILPVLISIMLIAASTLSARSLFYSPFIIQPNSQVSYMTIVGSSWSIQNQKPGYTFYYIMSSIYSIPICC
jgi:hypothetical protein